MPRRNAHWSHVRTADHPNLIPTPRLRDRTNALPITGLHDARSPSRERLPVHVEHTCAHLHDRARPRNHSGELRRLPLVHSSLDHIAWNRCTKRYPDQITGDHCRDHPVRMDHDGCSDPDSADDRSSKQRTPSCPGPPTHPPSSPTFNTAKKASCGISTLPTAFIRFLPSFCF